MTLAGLLYKSGRVKQQNEICGGLSATIYGLSMDEFYIASYGIVLDKITR